MNRPQLHFAPANGFPGDSYRSLFKPLELHFNVTRLDRLGHNPQYPVANNWHHLADELLENLQCHCGPEPVIGVGHSLGGVVTYLAALKAPERFQQILLLDPPLMTGLDSLGLKLAKRLGFIDHVTPARLSKGRRATWPDQATALEYFKSKKLFKQFHPQALADYVEAGTEQAAQGGIKLRFEPQIEVAIFRNLADHLSGSHKQLKVPASLIRGTHSDLMTPAREKKIRKMGFRCYQVPGGHMFPMENPEMTRKTLITAIHENSSR